MRREDQLVRHWHYESGSANMKTLKQFREAYGDKHQGHDVDNGPKKSEKKMKGKKDVKLKGGTSVTMMPKTPEGPDKALGIKEEVHKCGKGMYWCKEGQKCKPIPKGMHVMPNGDLMKGEKHK